MPNLPELGPDPVEFVPNMAESGTYFGRMWPSSVKLRSISGQFRPNSGRCGSTSQVSGKCWSSLGPRSKSVDSAILLADHAQTVNAAHILSIPCKLGRRWWKVFLLRQIQADIDRIRLVLAPSRANTTRISSLRFPLRPSRLAHLHVSTPRLLLLSGRACPVGFMRSARSSRASRSRWPLASRPPP